MLPDSVVAKLQQSIVIQDCPLFRYNGYHQEKVMAILVVHHVVIMQQAIVIQDCPLFRYNGGEMKIETFGEEWDWQGHNEGKEIEALKGQIACLTRQAERFDEVGNFVGWAPSQMETVSFLKGKLAEMRAEKAKKAAAEKAAKDASASKTLSACAYKQEGTNRNVRTFLVFEFGDWLTWDQLSAEQREIVESRMGYAPYGNNVYIKKARLACEAAGIEWRGNK